MRVASLLKGRVISETASYRATKIACVVALWLSEACESGVRAPPEPKFFYIFLIFVLTKNVLLIIFVVEKIKRR